MELYGFQQQLAQLQRGLPHNIPACHPTHTLAAHMQDAGGRREAVGVELYGFQQQLARLQRGLAAADAKAAAAAAERTATDVRVVELRRTGVTMATAAAAGQRKVNATQSLGKVTQRILSIWGVPSCYSITP